MENNKLNEYAENLMELSAKLNELSDLIFEESLKVNKPNTNSFEVNENNYEEVMNEVFDFINRSGHDSALLEYVSAHYEAYDVFSIDSITDSIRGEVTLDELFDESDILDWVYDNCYPEDLVNISWR